MATVYVAVGEVVVVDLIDGTSATHLDGTNAYIGWGTGAGTAADGDSDLFVPASESRVVAVASQPTADKNQWVATLTADAGKTITNAGLFQGAGAGNPPSGGTLIVKGDHAGQLLALGDKIQYTITLEQT